MLQGYTCNQFKKKQKKNGLVNDQFKSLWKYVLGLIRWLNAGYIEIRRKIAFTMSANKSIEVGIIRSSKKEERTRVSLQIYLDYFISSDKFDCEFAKFISPQSNTR